MDIMEQIKTNFIKVAENTTKIYNAGFEAGKKVGGGGELDYDEIYQSGYNAGKTESIQYWINGITDNGKRTTYQYAFSHQNLDMFNILETPLILKPTTTSTYMFRYTDWTITEEKEVDGETVIEDVAFPPQNLVLDLSEISNCQYLFQNSKIKHIGTIDVSHITSTTGINAMFSGCTNLHTIDKLIFGETKSPANTSTSATNAFYNCTNLVNLTIEGCISQSFNIRWCSKLSKNSILSILKALKISGVSPVITLPSACQSLVTGDTADAELNEEYIRATTELTYDIQFA